MFTLSRPAGSAAFPRGGARLDCSPLCNHDDDDNNNNTAQRRPANKLQPKGSRIIGERASERARGQPAGQWTCWNGALSAAATCLPASTLGGARALLCSALPLHFFLLHFRPLGPSSAPLGSARLKPAQLSSTRPKRRLGSIIGSHQRSPIIVAAATRRATALNSSNKWPASQPASERVASLLPGERATGTG